MSKLNNLKAEIILAPFRGYVGYGCWNKLCNDINSNLGRLEKDIVTKAGGWKVGTKGKLVAKDGHTLQLPLNAPWSSLVMFGLRLLEISQAGSSDQPEHKMEIQADLPAVCVNWFAENYEKKVGGGAGEGSDLKEFVGSSSPAK